MSKLKKVPENSTPPNLIMFPGGGRRTEADELLKRFTEVCLIFDRAERKRQFKFLRIAIFSHVTNMEKQGVNHE